MSGLLNLHADIARELYIEYVINQPGNEACAATAAISAADIFIQEYAMRTPVMPAGDLTVKQKGCGACFGSGGKIGKPCRVCAGSGKVPA